MNRLIYSILGVCLIVSCQQKTEQEPTKEATQAAGATAQQVVVEDSTATTDQRLASKGSIGSEHDVPVFSMVSAVIKERRIKEGMHVTKGQVLFVLDGTMQSNAVEKARRELEQAQFQYENILVGQGYDPSNAASIPQKIRKIARTRSSLNVYEQALHEQQLISAYYTIKAPISGTVTDLTAYQYDLAQTGKQLCRIVDTDRLVINFSILESELSQFSEGTDVHFSTISYPTEEHKASVTHISPKIDSSGMVKIRAAIEPSTKLHKLMVGMTAIVKK